MVPSAATSATAEPEISAKNTEVPIETIDKPPRIKPTTDDAKAISRREIEEAFMIAPDKMKSGMASSGKLDAPSSITSARLGSISGPCTKKIASIATKASATAIGTLMRASASMPTSIRVMVIAWCSRCRAYRARHAKSPQAFRYR